MSLHEVMQMLSPFAHQKYPHCCWSVLVLFVVTTALVGCSGTESSSGSKSAGGAGVGGAAGNGGWTQGATGGTAVTSVTGGPIGTGGQGPSMGGAAPIGGAATGGTFKETGGSTTTGGTESAGGVAAAGGSRASGGTSSSSGGGVVTGGTASAGGTTTKGGGTGTGGTATLPAQVCDVPTAWTLPTTSRVVGTGIAASCTFSALSNAVTAGGAVTFNCGSAPVTIAVTGAIQVSKATVVDGGGLITLDGGGANQIFLVSSNNSLSVRNLRFVNGKSPANTEAAGIGGAVSGNWRSKVEVIGCTFENNTAARGGGAVAVWTGSSLTIVASRFTGNVAWYGGAVYSLLSPLLVVNSEFTNNSTTLQDGYGDGGAIGTDGASESPSDTVGGTIQICGTKIVNNQGNGSGGGAYLWMYPPDQAIIDRTSVESNTVVKNATGNGAIGGAMRVSNGAIVIKDSSFLANTSIGNGAGLYLDCAPTCAITNTTFYANKNTAGWGGAIFSGTTSGQINIDNVTFANNAQQNTSGNATFGGATWSIHNSIFLDNGCANSGTGTHVLQWNSTSKSAGSGPCITGATAGDPKLAAPADNGGSTYTMLPGAGSATLQAGANCEATDQRGQTRNTAACDIGSVEVP